MEPLPACLDMPPGTRACVPEEEAGGLRELALGHRKRLAVAAVLGALVMAAELAAGWRANSLVLLADGAHYLTDVVAILIALAAVMLSLRPATPKRSYGYRRAEVLAALANAALLWLIGLAFIFVAVQRILHPPPVAGPLVAGLGVLSLAVNLALARLLHTHGGNVNLRAAYLHVLGDVLGSLAALVAGGLILWRGWRVADPALTLLVTLVILVGSWRLTRQTVHILLEGTPRHLDAAEIAAALRDIAPVKEVHELHVWTISSGHDAMSVHVVLKAPPAGDAVVHDIHHAMRERFRLDHVTVQVESPECPCESAVCLPSTATQG